MEKILLSRLKRDSSTIINKLLVKDDVTIARENLRIIFPVRFLDNNFATVTTTGIVVMNLFAIMDDDGVYSVSKAPIFVKLTPSDITDVEVNGQACKCLLFPKNTIMMPTNTLGVNSAALYSLFAETVVKGKVPWYIDYEDQPDLISESGEYAGSPIGKDTLVMETLAAIGARHPTDISKPYRTYLLEGGKGERPQTVGMLDVTVIMETTAGKIIGGYARDGLKSAVVEGREKGSNPVMDLLRK